MRTGRRSSHLSPVLLPPSKQAPFTFPASHDQIDILPFHSSSPRRIAQIVPIFEIDSMLVEQVLALLFVVCDVGAFSLASRDRTFSECRALTRRVMGPMQVRTARRWSVVRRARNGTWLKGAHARPKSLSLICPSGPNKKFCGQKGTRDGVIRSRSCKPGNGDIQGAKAADVAPGELTSGLMSR